VNLSLTLAAMLACSTLLGAARTAFAEIPTMKIADAVKPTYQVFRPGEVILLEGPFKHAEAKNIAYLKQLDMDRMLSGFRSEAGVEPKGKKYGGWESQGVAGHCLGHWLSGAAYAYATTKDAELLERINYVVDQLEEAQNANGDGYLCAFDKGKEIFARVEKGDITSQGFDLNGGWVPWYTIHKTMAGLRDVALYTPNKKALDVGLKNADWAIHITRNLDDALWQKMLACEHGGMNEVLADFYAITGEQKYKALADKFYHKAVLDPLVAKQNVLPGRHGNTQIPKLIGLSRLYELTGEEKYKTAADFFWNTVIDTQSYANGGNTSNEHFGQPHTQNARIGGNTSETCNTYNMLKLTRHLYTWRPSMKLADYAERATFNHILASQNPDDGMVIYYALLGPASKKNFSTPYDSFWCCVGTGMENHVRYGDEIYFKNDSTLAVNLFIASTVSWAEKNVTITQETKFPEEPKTSFVVKTGSPSEFTLRVRYPYWTQTDAKLTINGKDAEISAEPGEYIDLKRTWKDGDRVELELPMPLRTESLPDAPNRKAIFTGPVLLGGAVPSDKAKNPVLVAGDRKIDQILKPDGELMFETVSVGRPGDIELKPFYAINKGNYNVYWDFFTDEQWKQREADYRAEQERVKALEARTTDTFDIGEMQPERDHELSSERSRSGEHNGHKWRDAFDGGHFEFTMKVDPQTPNELVCSYWGSDGGGREFDILIDGKVIATQKLENDKPDQLFDVTYPIPAELTKDKETVRVRLQGHPGRIAGGLFGVRVVRSASK
jgi:DUF1680 family protein